MAGAEQSIRHAVVRARRVIAGHPTRAVVTGFVAATLAGTVLLMLPPATEGSGGAPWDVALVTATSAICVTGLAVVDTATYWSPLGQAVLLLLVQLGGFGLMTVGSVVGLLLARRIGLRHRMTAQAETGALQLGDMRRVVRRVAGYSLACEAAAALVLALRFWWSYDRSLPAALGDGVFHAVSAFNNAGFARFSDSFEGFAGDWWIGLTVCAAIIVGGLGFPVLSELRHAWRTPRRWSLHTKLTTVTTVALLLIGVAAITALEWSNPATLGGHDVSTRLMAGVFQGVNPRTAGFNSVPTGALRDGSLLVTMMLMFIGGGSASTAGGIKVTTFAVLGFVIWSEVRGDPDVTVFGRRIPSAAQRQALAVALLALVATMAVAVVLVVLGDARLTPALFEAVSAFGTVGLSTGVTPAWPIEGRLVLVGLMLVGRLGPITLFTALALRSRRRLYRYPEERPIVG